MRVLPSNLIALLIDDIAVARQTVVVALGITRGTAPFPPRAALDQRLSVTVVEAARQPGGAVLLEARFDVLDGAGSVLVRRRSKHHSTPAALGAAGAAAGLNERLAALGREIADVLRGFPPPER